MADVDRAAIRHHLDMLYGTADAGWLAVWHHPSKATTWHRATDPDGAAAAIAAAGATGNVYAGVGLHPAPVARGRGEASGVSVLPGLFVDVDIAGDGHKTGALPPDLNAAKRLIAAALPGMLPTYVVDTGHGLHCYWLLHECWELATDADRAHAQRLNRALQWLVIREGRRHGWAIDNTSDLARVLRPAGTVNRKPGLPERPVVVMRDHGQRFGIEDLEARLPLDDDLFPTRTAAPVDRPPSRAAAAHWSRITAQCGYLKHCADDAAVLSEPEWHAAMTVVARCVDGAAIAHRISAPYPAYDPAETDRKHAYAEGRDNPIRCATVRHERGGEPWCSRCPHWGQITSPIQLGYARGFVFAPQTRGKGTDA